ncbi:polycystin-2-like protein 2 [Tachypleus tridentatus]|uniref:polycystin-2-like protein 2 n=1 Tax=Tachypleus tridentatus TaxID=6853 RepID=UPI003FD1F771
MEFSKLILSIVTIVMYAIQNVYLNVVLSSLESRKGEFLNFHIFTSWNELFVIVMSFVVFISLLEILHLLRFNTRIRLLAMTLKDSSKDLMTFSVTFLLIFMAFAQFAYIAYGTDMSKYSGIIITAESMIMRLLERERKGKAFWRRMTSKKGGKQSCSLGNATECILPALYTSRRT